MEHTFKIEKELKITTENIVDCVLSCEAGGFDYTTKTDFHAIQELREKYAPKVRGIVSGEEAKIIYEVLEIDKRNNIELQNIRDMVVMIYGQWFDKSRDQYLEDKKKGAQAVDKSAEYLDAMSAIICVIDYEKFKRGLGV